MPTLSGLTAKSGVFEVEDYSHSVDEIVESVRLHGVATCAGHDAAINAWQDDDGCFRANLCSYGFERETHISKSLEDLRCWLDMRFGEVDRRW